MEKWGWSPAQDVTGRGMPCDAAGCRSDATVELRRGFSCYACHRHVEYIKRLMWGQRYPRNDQGGEGYKGSDEG